MARTLLDTDIFSEVIRDRNENVRARAVRYVSEHGRLLISSVTVMEVTKGLHRANRRDALERFVRSLANIDVISVGTDEALLAGRVYADLERTGQPMGRADPMVAGVVLARGLVLATGNVEHYERIKSLGYEIEIDNWREAAS